MLYGSLDTPPHAVFFMYTSIGGALSDILYFLVVWLREDISKCLNNLLLVVEQTNRISFGSFSDLQCYACAVGGIVFKRRRDQ